jgi:hypothetical protein
MQGTSDYAPGTVRVSFLVVDNQGRPIYRPRARFWVSRAKDEAPFVEATASLTKIGVPGGSTGDVEQLYVARVQIPEAGKYWALAEPEGGTPIQALGNLVVADEAKSPAVGDEAIPSRTPTLASTDSDFAQLTTQPDPDPELYRHSVADALRDKKPFVVAFATPKFCSSRTCGPAVDVLEAVREDFAESDVRFIHVEIYEDNDVALGLNRWVKEWRLPTEPWVFVVDAGGVIQAKFEGAVSVPELTAAVRTVAGA